MRKVPFAMKKPKPSQKKEEPRCGLCGNTKRLTRTECCGNWICDDEHEHTPFFTAQDSCLRSHSRFTLCAYHFQQGHAGKWQDCPECRRDFETEMYVWYGTNEFNFTKLDNPPGYEPVNCSRCGAIIHLAQDMCSRTGDGYLCSECTAKDLEKLFGGTR